MLFRSLVARLTTGVLETAEADDGAVGSLIEALDEIEAADKSQFSELGYKRLIEFSRDLRKLRGRANTSLTDLIFEIEEYLGLNVELLVRDGGSNGRRHLDRFNEEAAKFSASNGSISDFVRWLEATVDHERGLESGAPEVRNDVIQLLTIHMSKGAEWSHVVIPGIVEKQFPKVYSQSTISWLHNEAEIPFNLRGDGVEFPPLDLSQLSDSKLAAAEFKEFKSAKKFRNESKPITPMINKMKKMHKNPNSKVIINTARSDFDNKHEFLNTFRDQGVDIDKIHVHRTGNDPSRDSTEEKIGRAHV